MVQGQKYHYLYKTTCLVTGRYYIGIHSTENLEDEYLGSGRRLRYSLQKHGKENHTKEILDFFESREFLRSKEREIVNEDLLKDPLCMNLARGGEGGFLNREAASKGGRASIRKNGHLGSKEVQRRIRSDSEFKEKMYSSIHDSLERKTGSKNGWKGRKHREETIEKMRKSKNAAESNSQYGTCWIYHDIIKKTIKTTESKLSEFLSKGWKKGRKMRF